MFLQVVPVGRLTICFLIGFLVAFDKISGSLQGVRNNDYSHSGHYITIIEDRKSDPAGYLVMTADNNYAIYSPRLIELNWSSVTVNGALVFITTPGNRTIITGLFNLDERERDFIAEIRGEFTQNLAGLKLSRSASSDSLFSLSAKQPNYSTSDDSSHAERAIRLTESAYQMAGVQNALKAKSLDTSNQLPAIAQRSGARKLRKSALKQRARSNKLGQQHEAAWQTVKYGPIVYPKPVQQVTTLSPGLCSSKLTILNYYNLFDSQLANSISGDIYNFDMRCQIIDVYSKSVSVKQQSGFSVLYRNESYFAYSHPDLPSNINRFFLVGTNVFFVYNDRSLILKRDWLLNPLELDLVIGARRQLRAASNWRTKQAKTDLRSSEKDGQQQQQQQSALDNERAGSDKQLDGSQADQTTTPTTNDKQ